MFTKEQNKVLTETGPSTPMGKLFRAYWQPTLLSRELTFEGGPKRVTHLGEEWVAFRGSSGELGVVQTRCPHRGADLALGRSEECGLRCVYHGWKFDFQGNCIEIPIAEHDVAERVRPKAKLRRLSVAESCGIIWTHSAESPPPLPVFDFSELPESHCYVSKKLQQCNWAQALEGGIDTAHFSFLHANVDDEKRVPFFTVSGREDDPRVERYKWLVEDARPSFSAIEHSCGMVLCAAREAGDDQLYWRITQFMMPNHSMAPNAFAGEIQQGNTWVPIDDQSCWIFCYGYHPDRPLTDEERALLEGGFGIFAEVDDEYVPVRNRDNNYLMDRSVQRSGNLTGIGELTAQDAAIADSQGEIYDRTVELLGQTDIGIVRFRRMMLDSAAKVEQGQTPIGADKPDSYRVRAGDAMSSVKASAVDVLVDRFGSLSGLENSA